MFRFQICLSDACDISSNKPKCFVYLQVRLCSGQGQEISCSRPQKERNSWVPRTERNLHYSRCLWSLCASLSESDCWSPFHISICCVERKRLGHTRKQYCQEVDSNVNLPVLVSVMSELFIFLPLSCECKVVIERQWMRRVQLEFLLWAECDVFVIAVLYWILIQKSV